MVFPKVFHEVCLNTFAKACFNKVDVFQQVFVTESDTQEVAHTVASIIGKTTIGSQYRDNPIVVDSEFAAIVGVGAHFLGSRVRVSDVHPRLVKTVTSHPATDGVGNQLLGYNIVVPHNIVVLDMNFTLLEDGDFIERNIGGEFVLQTVYFNKLTVKFFLVSVKLHKVAFPFAFIFTHYDIKCTPTVIVEDTHQFILLEIPRSFVCVPIRFADGDANFYIKSYIITIEFLNFKWQCIKIAGCKVHSRIKQSYKALYKF